MLMNLRLRKGDRVAIVCCSNGQDIRSKEKIDELGSVKSVVEIAEEELGLVQPNAVVIQTEPN